MQAVKRTALSLRVLKKSMQGFQGIVIRAGIACLPLVAIVMLCLVVFSGLLRGRGMDNLPLPTEQLSLKSAVMPSAYAAEPTAEMTATGRKPRVQAAFERLHVTHATIRVPR